MSLLKRPKYLADKDICNPVDRTWGDNNVKEQGNVAKYQDRQST